MKKFLTLSLLLASIYAMQAKVELPPVFADNMVLQQQLPATLTLTVLDANGLPVIGAAVMKADGSGEITDLDGVCTISLSGSEETLT